MSSQGRNPFTSSGVNPFASSAVSAFGAPGTNPFAAPNPFGLGVAAQEPTVDADSAIGGYSYAMIHSGPALDPEEVEVANVASIEVITKWDSNTLQVDHLTPPRSYFVGEDDGAGKGQCDFFVPSEMLGAKLAPIVVVREGNAAILIPVGAHGYVDILGQGQVALKDLVASGRARPSGQAPGAYEFDLPAGAKARIELGTSGLVFEINAVNAGKAVTGGLFERLDAAAYVYFALSLVFHLGTVASLAFFMPHMSGDDSEAIDRDAMVMMQHLLDAAAEREKDKIDETSVNETPSPQGGTGARAKDEEGKMGKENTPNTGHKVAVAGPANNPDPHLARLEELRMASDGGFIGILNASTAGEPNAPLSPWGRDEASGRDTASFQGNIWGDVIGDSGGLNGFGLSGTGIGGGGPGAGYGLGEIGNLGRGGGPGDGDKFGIGHGDPRGAHKPKAPGMMRTGDPRINGHLPGEVIQRIVRQNFGRFTQCYQEGLRTNPSLTGRVSVKFAIDRTGSVMTSMDAGSDMPDANVISCVVRNFQNLSFPQPDGGIVTVSYPIMFTPGGE